MEMRDGKRDGDARWETWQTFLECFSHHQLVNGFDFLTVRCQRLAHQPIVFCVVRPTRISLALAKRAVSLFLLGLPPSFRASRGFAARARVCTPPTKPEEKERLLAVYTWNSYIGWKFLPNSVLSHWILRIHTTSKNETVSRQNLLVDWNIVRKFSPSHLQKPAYGSKPRARWI